MTADPYPSSEHPFGSPAKEQSEVERLAKALCEGIGSSWTGLVSGRPGLAEWNRSGLGTQWFWLNLAKIALAALPSEEQIRADERERCAKMVDDRGRLRGKVITPFKELAVAIRALGPREQDKPT